MNNTKLVLITIIIAVVVIIICIWWHSVDKFNKNLLDIAIKRGKYNFHTIETNMDPDNVDPKKQLWAYSARVYGKVMQRVKYDGIKRNLLYDQILQDAEKMGADVAQIDFGRDVVSFIKNPTYQKYSPRHMSIFNRKHNPMLKEVMFNFNMKYPDGSYFP